MHSAKEMRLYYSIKKYCVSISYDKIVHLINIEQIDEIVRYSFGFSIAGLFSAGNAYNLYFEQKKQTFLLD